MPIGWIPGPAAAMLLMLLLAVAIWAVRRVWAGYPESPHPGLARREAAMLRAAAEALYPAGGAVPASGADADLAGYAGRYLQAVPPGTRRLMRLLFFAFEHGTLVFRAPGPGGRRRYSRLSTAQRGAVLERWRISRWFPLRLAFTSLRAILTMGYFADPEVQEQLGFTPFAIDPPPVEADGLYPPVGQRSAGLQPPEAPLDPHQRGPAGEPLTPDSPRLGAAAPAEEPG